MDTPKMNAEVAAASLSAGQKERLHEVADLLLQIYKTLVEMRYMPPEAVIEGPHTLSRDILRTYEKCELSPSIVYLYSILPYIDSDETDAQIFFQGSTFFNPLSERDVTEGRDPRYLSPEGGFDEEDGKYMYPWYTPLSEISNEDSPMLIYDAERHVIWMVDQESSTDPAFCEWYPETDSAKAKSDWGDSVSSDSEWIDESVEDTDEAAFSDDDASHGSSEFWDDEEDGMVDLKEVEGMVADQDEEMDYDEGLEQIEKLDERERAEAALAGSKNENNLDATRHRPAGEALQDIVRWYRELKELPGQAEDDRELESEILRPLYSKNGWPDEFDGDSFEIDCARAYAKERARYFAEEPLREVERYEGSKKRSDDELKQLGEAIVEAKTLDDEWIARIALWERKEQAARITQNLKDAKEKAEKLCPGGICQKPSDLPIWELEQLRVETQWKRESMERASTHVTESVGTDGERRAKAQHRQALRKLETYEMAFRDSKADVDRLCLGRTFEEATGIKSLGRPDMLTQIASQKEVVANCEDGIRHTQNFASTVPRDAQRAVAKIGELVKSQEHGLQSARDSLERLEKWFAEHGNTD